VDRLGDRPGGEHHPGFTRTPHRHRHKEPRSPTVAAARSIDAGGTASEAHHSSRIRNGTAARRLRREITQPVAVVQAQDHFATCASIAIEVQANNKQVQDLSGEEGGKVAQNVAAGIAGVFIWPLFFAMDFQGSAGKEETALQSRQQYLAVLAEERHCGSPEPAVAVSAPAPIAPAAAVAPPPYTSVSSVAPATPGAASDTPLSPYEQAVQQYRQAEQQYQRQLEQKGR
jgi:hypothetical protein